MTTRTTPLRIWYKLFFLCLIMTALCHTINTKAQTLPANFQRVTVATGLNTPTAMAFTPDGRILICQKGGQLRVYKNGSLLSTPAITLSVNTAGERGLIGVAVDPAFTTNNLVYLYYSTSGTTKNRVSRFTMNGDVLSGEQVILDFPNDTHMYHNGGGITFGADGKLYVLAGDDTNTANATNLDSPFGKVLRINPDGSIPAGNPFTGGTTRSKVWAYGVRNPYTLASDPQSGKLFVNDVGNATWEEINDATTGGKNFGWPSKEGMCTSGCAGLTNPIYVYSTNRNSPPPNGQGCAINGGTFFNGAISNYPAVYNGKYFFLDYCGGWIDYINPAVASPTRTLFGSGLPDGMVYIKQGTDGNLYFLNLNNGSLYRIIYTLNNQAPVITQQPQPRTVPQGGTATFSVTATGSQLTYQWRKGTTNIAGATASTYTITNVQPSHEGNYNVVVTNPGGSVTSNNASLTVTSLPTATITTPANNTTFRAGDVISYAGTATDPDDGTLPPSAYEWFLDFRHENHGHGGPELADGVTSGSFTIDTRGHAETNVWYRLFLVVTDSDGAKDTAMVELFPVVSDLNFTTQPAGLQILVDNIPISTPRNTEGVSGTTRPIAPVSPQTVGGTTYVFDRWAHGGPASQTITITDNAATYTAIYKVAPAPVILTPTHDAYVRNGAHAATTHGTTDAANLIVKRALAAQVDNTRETYFKFDLTSITGAILAVQLKVFGRIEDASVTNLPVEVFSASNTTWTESAITWNNKPATSATAIASSTVTDATARYYLWDVTDYVKNEVANGRRVVTLAMKSVPEHNPRTLWSSKETGTNPPQLSVVAEAGGNASPITSITSPANGATFAAPATVTIDASAADSDGTIAKVEFFNGTTKLGEDTSSPYSFAWTNVSAGTYSLTTVATDNLGATGTSTIINITVQAGPSCPPVIASADDGNVPANVLDDNLSTRWSANGDGQWIQFCLPTQQSVRGVAIAFYSGNVRSSNFDVLTSLDANTWTTAAAGLSSSGTSLDPQTFTFTPRTAKYVRIVGHGNSVNTWNSYTEVDILTVTAPACEPATASADDGNVATNVLDNNTATRWSASGDGQWIQFCLSATSTVSGVQIAFYKGNERQSAFDVLVSADASTWTSASTGRQSSGTSLALETFTFTAVTAKYVRIVGHGNNVNAWNSYTEVRITSTPALSNTAGDIATSLDESDISSHPNPTDGLVTITYRVSQPGRVTLSIHNTRTNHIINLIDKAHTAGTHQFTLDTRSFAPGVHVLKLTTSAKTTTHKLLKN
jgi:glucose/arabinose dehydrogenase